MNKDQATNDDLTAAILVLEKYVQDNKKDVKVEITGLEFNLSKGV